MVRLIVINILVFIAIALGVDYLSGFYLKPELKGVPITQESSVNFYQDDPVLGYKPFPNVSPHVVKRKGDEVIYEVDYEFDQYSRRVVPFSQKAERHAIFLGDSNVFGEGLKTEDTWPFLFSQAYPRFRVYNYAFPGYGPGQALALLESDRLPNEIEPKKGLTFYVFRGDLASRLVGSLHLFTFSLGRHPFYEWDPEKGLTRNKSFREAQPWLTKFKRFVAGTKLFRFYDRDFPDPFSKSNFTKICAALVKMNKEMSRSPLQSIFVVVLAFRSYQEKHLNMTKDCLKEHKMNFIDISAASDKMFTPEWSIHELDPHMNGVGNRALMEEMAKELAVDGFTDL